MNHKKIWFRFAGYTLFNCSVCSKNYTHPDSAIECEASHYDAWGVCPNCDNSNSAFDKLGQDKFVCRECSLIVKNIIDFITLVRLGDQENSHSERYRSRKYSLSELAWLNATGNYKDKAVFHEY